MWDKHVEATCRSKYWSHGALDCRDAEPGTASQSRGGGEVSLSFTALGQPSGFGRALVVLL